MCVCASVCVQVLIVQSQAPEQFAKTRIHKYQPFIMLICSKVPDVNYVFRKEVMLHISTVSGSLLMYFLYYFNVERYLLLDI